MGMGALHPLQCVADGDGHQTSESQLLRNGKLNEGAKDLAQPYVSCRAPWNQFTVGKAELAKKGPESTAFLDIHTRCWFPYLCVCPHSSDPGCSVHPTVVSAARFRTALKKGLVLGDPAASQLHPYMVMSVSWVSGHSSWGCR